MPVAAVCDTPCRLACSAGSECKRLFADKSKLSTFRNVGPDVRFARNPNFPGLGSERKASGQRARHSGSKNRLSSRMTPPVTQHRHPVAGRRRCTLRQPLRLPKRPPSRPFAAAGLPPALRAPRASMPWRASRHPRPARKGGGSAPRSMPLTTVRHRYRSPRTSRPTKVRPHFVPHFLRVILIFICFSTVWLYHNTQQQA